MGGDGVMARLEEICSLITDGSHFSPEDEGVGYPMFSVKDMTPNGFNISGCKKIGEEAYKKLVANGCKPLNDDVVVAKDGSYLKTAFVIKGNPEITLLSSIAILRPKIDLVVPEYLSYFLKSDAVYRTVSLNYITGTALKRIILKGIRKIEVDLPDIGEQEQRAQRLSKVDYLCQLRKQQLAKLDELVKARFVEMFGTFPANPFRWDTGKIQDVVSDVRYGSSRPAVEGGKYPYLRMNNITYSGELDLRDTKRIDIPDSELDKCTVRRGDVLFNRTNSKELVGKTCVYNRDELMVLAGFVIRVRVNERIRPEVLSAFLNMDFSKRMLIGMCKTAIGQANINAKELQNIDLYIPPIELQDQFVTLKNKTDQQKQTVQQSLEKLELMKKALMQEYFG